jgi:hypothetical protein
MGWLGEMSARRCGSTLPADVCIRSQRAFGCIASALTCETEMPMKKADPRPAFFVSREALT